jgi:hypothetical protein
MDTNNGNVLGGIVIGLIAGAFGVMLFTSSTRDADTNLGWTPAHSIWAYQSCTSAGGAGEAVTDEGVDNYLQFCKEAIVCASHSEPTADVNINSYEVLSELLAKCKANNEVVQ